MTGKTATWVTVGPSGVFTTDTLNNNAIHYLNGSRGHTKLDVQVLNSPNWLKVSLHIILK